VMVSSMFQGVPMDQICSTRVGSMGGRETETSGCCALVVGHGITFLGGGRGGLFLLCPHTQHLLVYASTTQEIGYRVCRWDVETIGGVLFWTKTVEDEREDGVLCVVCLFFVSLFFLFFHMIFTLTFDVVCVKDKGSCV
jgi:hypothetical protein